ncbi:MAG: hypothetical protein QG559_790 [Campylobacterota bacterium]|nr:hypothetical protein [Campylobacterota bacterium]
MRGALFIEKEKKSLSIFRASLNIFLTFYYKAILKSCASIMFELKI